VGRNGLAAGAAGLHLVDGLSLLRPEEQVFTAMLDGWRNQQLARNLAFSTINGREKAVQAFARHADHRTVGTTTYRHVRTAESTPR
jgi:hypothetical protein